MCMRVSRRRLYYCIAYVKYSLLNLSISRILVYLRKSVAQQYAPIVFTLHTGSTLCAGFRFAHPIYVDGDYPPVMKFQIEHKSKEQGLNQSRLPVFTDDEKRLVKGMLWGGFGRYTNEVVGFIAVTQMAVP